MLLFRRKYPGWWADWNRQLLRFGNRVHVYVWLMDDAYPSTDEEQSVHLDFPQPDGEQLSRWMPLVKWLAAIPHYIILIFLYIAAFFAVFIAWFAILFSGTYPRSLFDFAEGVLRWGNRVCGLRVHPRHRRVPAVQPAALAAATRAVRSPYRGRRTARRRRFSLLSRGRPCATPLGLVSSAIPIAIAPNMSCSFVRLAMTVVRTIPVT